MRAQAGIRHIIAAVAAVMAWAALPLLPARADVLAVGKPAVSGNQYTFPIVLNSDSNDVAVMDFQFQYDPAVFRPVEARSGPQADYANKLINANQTNPGEYIVVLWGPNQNTLGSGEVARIVMEHTGVNSAQTQLAISRLTMASPDGIEIDSQAQSLQVQLGDNPQPPQNEEPPSPPDDGNNPPEPPVDEEPGNVAPGAGGFMPLEPGIDLPGSGIQPSAAETKPGVSQNAPSGQENINLDKIAQLARQAAALRGALPRPDEQAALEKSAAEKDFPKSGNDAIIKSASVRAEPEVDELNTASQLGQIAALSPRGTTGGGKISQDAATTVPGTDAQASSAGATVYLVGFTAGGLVIGLILLFSLRRKMFA